MDLEEFRTSLMAKTKLNSETGCLEWTGYIGDNGYGQAYDPTRRRLIRTHRLSYHLNKGPIPNGLFVLHTCDNRCCINPEHLYLGGHIENTADKVSRNRQARVLGTSNGKAKLTPEIVREIRAISDMTHPQIARKFGIGTTLVYTVRTRRSWAHVD